LIPARKSAVFTAWFARHVEKRIAKSLQRVEVRGLEALRGHLAAGPVVLVSNHQSYWDVMIGIWLVHRVLAADPYGMMDAANLRRLPFFTRIGVFGVERGEKGLGRESLTYAAGLLDRPGRVVWIFPQGDERPSTLRPLGFRRGAAVVAAAAPGARVVPLALRYELGKTELPYAWLDFGPALAPTGDVGRDRDAQEAAVVAGLDRIDAHLCRTRDAGFEVLHRARPSRAARLAEWVLARVNRRHGRSEPRPLPPPE
jgi:1-acyl-sn-glycerol-3-phosphate acyltransferase